MQNEPGDPYQGTAPVISQKLSPGTMSGPQGQTVYDAGEGKSK